MADQQTIDPAKEVQGLIATLDEYLVKKAPFQLPEDIKELIVRLGPWIALVLLILLLPMLFVALGIGGFRMPFARLGYAAGFGLAAILACVQIVLIGAALPALFARKISGWMLLFYEQLVSLVAGLARRVAPRGPHRSLSSLPSPGEVPLIRCRSTKGRIRSCKPPAKKEVIGGCRHESDQTFRGHAIRHRNGRRWLRSVNRFQTKATLAF